MSDPTSPRGKEDSGLINLDALMGAAAPEPAPVVAPPVALPAPPVAPPAPPVAPPAPPVAPPAPPPTVVAEKRPRASLLRVLAALCGVVAVAFFLWRTSTPPTAIEAPPPPPVTATAAAKAPSEPRGMDPNALPAADVAPSASAAPTITTAAPSANVTAPVGSRPDAPAKITQKDLGTMPASDPRDLAGAMKSAVGSQDAPTETTKAPESSGANQIRPAAGQVVGAIGAVLPAARACLGPDDSIRSGSLVFSSDGSVKQVSLSGDAKPTDACIKAALSKAKLQPFTEDSFTTRVTVRP